MSKGTRGVRSEGWVTRHPLLAGWIWTGVFVVLIGLAEAADWHSGLWSILLGLLVLPPMVATVALLLATPRQEYHDRESVFGHFFVRYLVLVVGFLAWSASVVLGAAISTSIQLIAEEREDEVVATGFALVLGMAPLAIGALWIVFLLRCVWFLSRMRGWRAVPRPEFATPRLLPRHPRLRRVTVGLAHPGLLLVVGILSIAGYLMLAVFELTVLLD